jgi:alkanesulfonate monooxygenase SsuD/methylene tetrahydromethanopterin reductase-like flavin-dependent oxidoreductase (luciferase family)
MDNINKPITFHWMWRRHWQVNDSTEHLDLKGILGMAQELDSANVKSVLLPYGPGGIDFSLVIQEALQKTNQLIMTIALPAYGTSPDYAAKIVDTLNQFAPGRIGVNLVAGRWGDEGNGPSEKIVLDHYMHDSSLIDTLEKRVAISEVWMDKFMNLMKTHKYKTHMAVVGSSDTTIRIANKHCEYAYVDDNLLYRDQFKKINLDKVKPIVIIDPLIINNPDDEANVKYDENAPVRKQHHHVKGTIEEVKKQIKELSAKFNVYDFMIHTDQEDISQLLKLVKEFNGELPIVNKPSLTHEHFTAIGSGSNNVKVFNNYLTKETCDDIIRMIKETETSNVRPLQSEALSLIYYDSLALPDKYVPGVHSLLEKEYGVTVKPRHSRFAEWRHNNSQIIPIDDMGSKDSNHMAGWVYLNDDYHGGELNFFNQGINIKPKAGDLVMFPGNMHYWYNVGPANGSRYIMPIWFDFV